MYSYTFGCSRSMKHLLGFLGEIPRSDFHWPGLHAGWGVAVTCQVVNVNFYTENTDNDMLDAD